MAFNVTSHKLSSKRGIFFDLDLTNLNRYRKVLREALQGEIFYDAARHLQKIAFDTMEAKFQMTKGKTVRLKSNPKDSIEHRLFGQGVPRPKKINNTKYEIVLIPNYGQINNDLKHLKWQERGTRANIHMQAYMLNFGGFGNRKLYNITERRAKELESNPATKKLIKRIAVPHPAIKPRHFIKAALELVQKDGQRIVNKYIRDEMRKRLNQ